MIFHLVSIGTPTVLYFLVPKLIKADKEWRWLLFVACLVYFFSWYVPSPIIDDRQTQFMTHLVGGGIFTGLLWLYVKLVKNWQAAWWTEAASLFALVSSLGVINELFEFLLYKSELMPQGITDTSYDLVANTLGAMILYAVYKITKRVFPKKCRF